MTAGRLDKKEGSYYTPCDVADKILDLAGYMIGDEIIFKKIIDPAAGDGAILVRAVKRLAESLSASNLSDSMKASIVCDSLYAIELDETELQKCRDNVVRTLSLDGIEISPDDLMHFVCADTTKIYKQYSNSMDFVVGNPPYVRIHNLEEKPDSTYVQGMCDLYYAFFDYGQQMLSDNGTLSFLSPSSWFSSSSGKAMRDDLNKRRAVKAIHDYGHTQLFAPYATTYTAITVLTRTPNDDVFISDANTMKSQSSCWIDSKFFPSAPAWMPQAISATGNITVRNGYATNLDKIYFAANRRGFGSLERIAIKASTCEKHYMLYPYENGKLLPLDDIAAKSEDAYLLLLENKQALCRRNKADKATWWQFARSQGIIDTEKERVAMQCIIKPGLPIKTCQVKAGWGVYGGVYVMGLDKEKLDRCLDNDFASYVQALRHYKSGGYYSVSGREIEHFLNWKISAMV